LSIIGENPLLYAGIAYAHWSRANVGVGGEEEVDKSEQYARRALELDSGSAEAHLVLGVVYQALRGDQRQAFHHLNRSLSTNPNDPHTVLYTFWGHFTVGRPDASRPHVERLLHLDPLNPLARWLPVGIELAAGRFDRFASYAWDEWPPWPPIFFYQTLALVYTQRLDEARAVIREWGEYGWKDFVGSFHTFIYAAIERNKERMEAHLAGNWATTGRRDPMWSYWIAGLLACAGEADAAFEWVTNAVDRGFINYPLLADHDPFLSKFRGAPRYDALLERVKSEWETFEV
jgi:tetratricopeptide (TPR) repeat protein